MPYNDAEFEQMRWNGEMELKQRALWQCGLLTILCAGVFLAAVVGAGASIAHAIAQAGLAHAQTCNLHLDP